MGAAADADALEQLTEFLYVIPIAVMRFRADGSIQLANPPVAQLLLPLMPPGDLDNAFTSLGRLIPGLAARLQAHPARSGIVVDHQRHAAMAGPRRIVLSTTIHRLDPDVHVAVIEDVTERAEQERQLEATKQDLATRRQFDILTGLASRSMLEIELAEAEPRDGKRPALIFLDVIGAKAVSEDRGFHVGDALLVAIAQRVVAVAGPDAVVARLTGHDFAVLCWGMDEAEVEALGAAIRTALAAPFDIDGQVCHVRAMVALAFVESRAAAD